MTDDDWKKLSTEEKCEHKNWKARVEGYEECCKLFRLVDDPKNPIYLNYLGLVKKFVVDSNEVAKDKALDAVLSFVENVPAAAKSAGEVIPGLISKCLNGKAKTKEKAFDIIMMYIEAEKQEIVQEELIKGLDNKQPKIVQACLEILRRAINEFSSKTIPIKPIIKFVPKLLEDRDKSVRDETKLLAVEMYRWAGQAIMPQLQGVKPSLLQELEEEFKNAASEKPRQTRFLRSQQDLKAKMEQEMENRMMNGGGGGGGAEANGGADVVDSAPESIDPYDLMEPAEILSKLPKDFKEKIEAKKWQERKEVLDTLLGILQKNPRLQVTDYHDLVTDLKKMVAKDANINIVVTAAKCITGIAKGIRKDFSKYALMCLNYYIKVLGAVDGKVQRKKQNVVDALREACDAIYPSTNLEAIQEMCIGYLAHKTPCVRQNVALFLARCFAMSTQTTLPKKILKLYLPALVKNLSEADPTVRDSSSEALGAIFKALGEKIFMPQIGEIEPVKLEKIKEYAEKTVLLNLRGEPRVAPASAAPVAQAAVKQDTKAPAKDKPTIKKPDDSKKPVSAKSSSDAKGDQKAKTVKGGADSKKPSVPEEPDFAQETVEEKALELFGNECVNGLASSNWKDRLSSIETLANHIKRMIPDEAPVQIIIRTLAKKPGFKDSHFQVLKQRLELVAVVADTGFKFSQRSASYCLTDIADKIGDAKASEQAKNALSKIGEQCTLPYVCTQIVPAILEGKNPKNQEQVLLWLSQAIKEFGFQGCDMKFLLGHIKTALQNSNVSVRSGAIQLISTIYMFVGPSFRSLFDQEKPALLEQIDAEIEKVKGQKPPTPIRGKNVPNANSNQGGSQADPDDDPNDPVQLKLQQEALMPRTDISSQLTEELMVQLNDKNWKERQAALEKIDQILRDNKFIEPNLGEFPTNLNKRITDANQVLVAAALKICEKLAQALGSQGKRYISVLSPGMIQALGNSKEALRKTAISALNAWFDNCGGLNPFLEGELMTEAFAATNPNIKAELCGWLTQVLPKCKAGKLPPELKAIIPCVFTFVEDRNQDVRTKSQELITPLMVHVGPNEMLRVMQKAKPTSINILQPLIDKARAEIAAKQPPPVAKPAPPPAQPTNAPKKVARGLYDDSPEESSNEDAPPPEKNKKEPAKAEKTNGKGKEAKENENEKPPEKNNKKAAPAPTTKKNKNDDEDLSPAMQLSNKNKRVDEEKALKTLKWNFDNPRKEFIEQLKSQMEAALFNKTLLGQLFHDDFKYHIIALQTLTKAIDDLPDATLSNLDLILRWLTLRFFETNPTVIVKAIDYMQALFNMLINVKKYHLLEYEANAFIPYFIGKLGDPKDPIRKGFRLIIKQITQIYSPVKVFTFLLQGLASKNARQRAECLEELGQMIEALGLNSFNPAVNLKEIAKQIGDRDNSVRNAALNTITIAFQIAGEQVYKYIGKLNEKDQSMLDERIKRSSKPAIPGVKSSVSGSINQQSAQNQLTKELPQIPIPSSNSYTSIQTAVPTLNQTNISQNSNSVNNLNEDNKPPTSSGRVPAKFNSTPRKGQSLTQQIVSPSSNINQPLPKIRGEFSLDIKDDDDERETVIPVRLTSHQDLDDLLNKPIDLPPPRKNITTYPINKLKETQDCKEAIDLVITHISHQNIEISIQNLLQIDVVIKDKDKKELLIPHIDNLLNTCSVKLNVAHNVYLSNPDCQVELVFKLFKGIFHCMMDLFDSGLGKTASIKSLRDVFYNLLSLMTDNKIGNYQDGDQLFRAINLVMLKLLETSNQTTCYCALVKLLSECCDQENYSTNNKYLELVMKCIWRQIRRLSPQSSANNNSQFINENLIQQIDTSKVLSEIHSFLRLYPSSSWQTKSSDLPLRTVKTLVFHLAKAKQSQIIDDLNSINVPDDAEIKIYIMKLFKNGFQLSNANNSANTSGNNSFGFSSKSQMKQPQQVNKTELTSPTSRPHIQVSRHLSDELSLIIKKIGNTETCKHGLNELYDFKQQHPDFDTDKYFKNSSGRLQSYIEENLKMIEMERNKSPSSSSTSSSSSANLKSNCKLSPESAGDFKPVSNRNVDDIMKTIADWKSKTNLNKLDDDDNDENNLRTFNNAESKVNSINSSGSNGRLFQKYQPNGSSKLLNINNNESENSIKAEKYLDIVKDLKKKYTRSRTEPVHRVKSADDESDQLNDLKQLDLKAKNLNENSSNNGNSMQQQQQQIQQPQSTNNGDTTSNTSYAQMSSDNLYDEYRRRLELIKNIKKIK